MRQKIFIVITGILLLFTTAACGGKDTAQKTVVCPFTEMAWDASADDVISAETGGESGAGLRLCLRRCLLHLSQRI